MTAHELARLLLAGPDIPVMIAIDDQHGLLSEAEPPVSIYDRTWREDDDYTMAVDPTDYEEGDSPVIVLAPEKYS